MPAEELLCACDVPHCSQPNCTGKVCFVSKRKEEGTITQHRGCFSQNILEQCRTPVTEQYGMRCCDFYMCNAELEIFLQGTGAGGRGDELPTWLEMWLGLKIVPVLTQHVQSHLFPGETGPPRCPQVRCRFLGCACRAATHGVGPDAETLSPGPSPNPRPPPSQVHPHAPIPRFPHPGEDALGKTPSLPNLLLMIFVPLLALLVLVALTAFFCWKVAQHRHKHSDFGDTDLMLKASMVGDSTLEVGELREMPQMSPRCVWGGGLATMLTPWPPCLHRTCSTMTAPRAVVPGCPSSSSERWLGRSPSWSVWVRRAAELGAAAPLTPSWCLSDGTTNSNQKWGWTQTCQPKPSSNPRFSPCPADWGGREQLGG